MSAALLYLPITLQINAVHFVRLQEIFSVCLDQYLCFLESQSYRLQLQRADFFFITNIAVCSSSVRDCRSRLAPSLHLLKRSVDLDCIALHFFTCVFLIACRFKDVIPSFPQL